MPSEVSTVSSAQSVEALRRELAEAREQQAATRAILGAQSNSSTDSGRVFAEIAASAARLCDGYSAGIFRLDGEQLPSRTPRSDFHGRPGWRRYTTADTWASPSACRP